MLAFGAETAVPPSAPVGEVCIPVVGCLPVSGGISEGGYIVLLLLTLCIIVGIIVILVFWRYGAVILKNVREVKHETKNDHDKNLRDDIDEKDAGSHRKLDTIVAELQSIRRDMSSGFESVHGRIDGLDSRVTGIDVRLNRRA